FAKGLTAITDGVSALSELARDAELSSEAIQAWFESVFTGTVSQLTPNDEVVVARLQAEGLHWFVAWFRALAGYPQEASTIAERFLAIIGSDPKATEGIRFATAFAHHGHGIAHAALGRPDEAEQAWARARTIFQ